MLVDGIKGFTAETPRAPRFCTGSSHSSCLGALAAKPNLASAHLKDSDSSLQRRQVFVSKIMAVASSTKAASSNAIVYSPPNGGTDSERYAYTNGY